MTQMFETLEEAEAPRRRVSAATAAGRRRFAFFCLASLWGYVLGIAVLAAAMASNDLRVSLDSGIAAWITIGAMVGIAGGLIVASAYREARRRHR
jgi:hypothetical protein